MKIAKSKKPKSLSSLKKKLWKYFSLYIRLRESDKNLFSECVTCEKKESYKNLQAGHFIPGRTNSILFVEDNCFPQCKACNIFLHGNIIAYYEFMVKRFGLEKVSELKILKRQNVKLTREWYEQKTAHYKAMVARWLGEV